MLTVHYTQEQMEKSKSDALKSGREFGRNETWEFVKRLFKLNLREIFGIDNIQNVLGNYSASDAMEKYKKYMANKGKQENVKWISDDEIEISGERFIRLRQTKSRREL